MAGENLERVRAAIPERADMVELLASIDPESPPPGGISDLFADDIAVDFIAEDAAMSQAGAAGFVRGWQDWLEPWESYVMETEELREEGDKVIQLVKISARLARGAIDIQHRALAVWTLRDGKAIRVEFRLEHDRR